MEIKELARKYNSTESRKYTIDFLKLNDFQTYNGDYFTNKNYPNLFVLLGSFPSRVNVGWKYSDNTSVYIFVCEPFQFPKLVLFLKHFDYNKQVEITKLEVKNGN